MKGLLFLVGVVVALASATPHIRIKRVLDETDAEPIEDPATGEPAPGPEEPAPFSEDPATATEDPALATEAPAPATDEPAPAPEEPASFSEEPAPASEAPDSPTDAPYENTVSCPKLERIWEGDDSVHFGYFNDTTYGKMAVISCLDSGSESNLYIAPHAEGIPSLVATGLNIQHLLVCDSLGRWRSAKPLHYSDNDIVAHATCTFKFDIDYYLEKFDYALAENFLVKSSAADFDVDGHWSEQTWQHFLPANSLSDEDFEEDDD